MRRFICIAAEGRRFLDGVAVLIYQSNVVLRRADPRRQAEPAPTATAGSNIRRPITHEENGPDKERGPFSRSIAR